MKPKSITDTEIHTWFERDRAHVELRDKRTGKPLVEWWDDDVRQAVEDGFLNPRNYHSSAFDYWLSMQPKRKTGTRIQKNPKRERTRTREHGIDVTNPNEFAEETSMRENPLSLKPIGANRTQLTLDDGTIVFFSYQTPVAVWYPENGQLIVTAKSWSRTTSKHIGEFARSLRTITITNKKPQEWFDTLVSGIKNNPKGNYMAKRRSNKRPSRKQLAARRRFAAMARSGAFKNPSASKRHIYRKNIAINKKRRISALKKRVRASTASHPHFSKLPIHVQEQHKGSWRTCAGFQDAKRAIQYARILKRHLGRVPVRVVDVR